jgi:hypothetical protein
VIDKRIKYEYGQLVKNRPNGKRPGYRGGGGQAGGTGDMGGGSSSGSGGAADGPGDTGGEGGNNPSDGSNSQNGGNNNNNNGGGADRPNYDYKGPADLGVTTRTVNTVKAPEAKEYIGGKEYDVTPDTKDERDNAREQQTQLGKTTIDELITSFAPVVAEKKGFWDYAKQALGILSFLNPGTTIGRIGLAVNTLDKVSTISTLAKDLGITEKDVIASLKDNFKDGSFGGFTNTTSSINPNDRIGSDNNQEGDNQFFTVVAPEGIMKITEDMKIKKTAPTENVIGSLPNASLPNVNQQSMTFSPRYTRSNVANKSEKGIANLKGMGESFADVFKTDTNISVDGEGSSALLKEYAMLLKQMEQGLLQTEGRERLNILKSRLGLAQGGITNVNMKKGNPREVLRKLGEVLYG